MARMFTVTADTITDDQIVALVKLMMAIKPEERIDWLGMGDEAMAPETVGAPYKPYCRRRCASAWNDVYDFDLDVAKELWHSRKIDSATWDDALIDVTTRNPAHVERRWRALAKCVAAKAGVAAP